MKVKYLEDRKNSINLFLLVFAVNTAVFITKSMFTSAMAMIVEEGAMTKSQTGLISALFWIVYAVFQILGGFVVEKISLTKSVAIGIISGIISNFIIFFNQSYWVVVTVWCINAAFQFGLYPASFKIVSTQTHKRIAEFGVLWITFVASVGETASMFIASLMPKWHYSFFISGVMLIPTLIIWVIGYRLFERKMTEKEININLEESSDLHKSEHVFSDLMKKSGLFVIFIIYFLMNALRTGLKSNTPVMLMESYEKIPAAVATRLSIILIVFSVAGIFLSNIVRDKFTKNEVTGAIWMSLLALPGLAGACFVGKISYIWILVFLSVATIFLQAGTPFMGGFVSSRFGKYGLVGAVTGVMNGFSAAAYFISAYVFPSVAEKMNWTAVTVLWIVILACVVAGLSLVFKKWTDFISK